MAHGQPGRVTPGAGVRADSHGDAVIDRPLADLPWEALHAELLEIGRQEARRAGVHHQEVEDAVQSTVAKIFALGPARVPACLLGERRGAWLRPMLQNAILRIRDAERRWRQIQTPLMAASRAAALQWPRHSTAGLRALDLSRLWPEEVHVVVLLHLGLRPEQIAEIDGLTTYEVARRALWGGLRGKEPPGRVPAGLGREPGSLAGVRGAERREWIALLDRHGWPDEVIARELGITANALRRAREYSQARCESRRGERSQL